jgi:hypothetical protein
MNGIEFPTNGMRLVTKPHSQAHIISCDQEPPIHYFSKTFNINNTISSYNS